MVKKVRNVTKSLAGMEDFQQLRGPHAQTRNGKEVTVHGMDVPYAVDSIAEMQALDLERFRHARVYSAPTTYVDYLYDPDNATGVPVSGGGGSWIARIFEAPAQAATIAGLRTFEPDTAGQQIDLLGHTLAGIGGGKFYYDATDTTSADDNGTIVITTGDKRWKRVDLGYTTPEMFGSVGDIVTDTAGILACNSKRGLIDLKPNKTYLMSTGFTLDVSNTLIRGSHSVLDFSGATPPYTAMKLISSDIRPNPYFNNGGGTYGVSLVGVGKDGGGAYQADVGILVAAPSASQAVAGYAFNDGSISQFGKGVVIEDNGYNVGFHSSSIFRCGVDVEMLGGIGGNYGEKVVFNECVLFNSSLTVRMGNGAGGLFFNNCSFDYSLKTFEVTGGVVHLQGCHVEFDPAAITDTPFDVSGEAQLIFDGGWLLTTGGVWTQDYCAKADGNATIIFDKVRMINLQPLVSFDAGSGRVLTNDCYYNPIPNMNTVRKDSQLANGDFEAADLSLDLITVYRDTAVITDRLVGANLELSLSAVNPDTGTQSLRAAKMGGNGSAAEFIIAVPCEEGDVFSYSFRANDNDSRMITDIFTNTFYGRLNGYDSSGVPLVTPTRGPVSQRNYTASAGYVTVSGGINGGAASVCPVGSNCYFIRINLNGLAGGPGATGGGNYSVYFDNFHISKW